MLAKSGDKITEVLIGLNCVFVICQHSSMRIARLSGIPIISQHG